MIKSLLPFSLSRDKRKLIPNPHIFGDNTEPIDFPDYYDTHKKVSEDIKTRNVVCLDNLNYIKLDHTYKTTFWRYQNNSDACLATIEAAYYCIKEIAGQIPEKCKMI